MKLPHLPAIRALLLSAALLTPLDRTEAQGCATVTELGSRADGSPGNGPAGTGSSTIARPSADGRYIVFASTAEDLVSNDANGQRDVFRRDRLTGDVELASLAADGTQGDGSSSLPSVSDDGQLIAFESLATNLVPGDTNGTLDVFVKDMTSGALERVSLTWLGTESTGNAFAGIISGDGRYVAFQSSAGDLTGGTDTLGFIDVFVRDRQLGTTKLASPASGGGFANGNSLVSDLSRNGRWVVYRSVADDHVGLDTNSQQDVFRYDLQTGSTVRVSLGPQLLPGLWAQGDGDSSGGAVSDDGATVAFDSFATNLDSNDTNGAFDVFVRDLQTGTTTLVSRGPGGVSASGSSNSASLSGDGNTVVFASLASDLVGNDTNGQRDVFAYDAVFGAITRASVDGQGLQGFAQNLNPEVSRDGAWIGWESAWPFDPDDTNGVSDVYVRGQDCTFPAIHCTAKTTSNGCTPRILWAGEAKADLTGGFEIIASEVINQKPGLLFYGLSGRAALPFQQGFLCVQPPTKRAPITFSGGNPPPDDCSGRFSLDMDAYASGALGGSPLPQLTIPGTVVNAQWWGRDPGYAAPNDTLLTNALEYTVRP